MNSNRDPRVVETWRGITDEMVEWFIREHMAADQEHADRFRALCAAEIARARADTPPRPWR